MAKEFRLLAADIETVNAEVDQCLKLTNDASQNQVRSILSGVSRMSGLDQLGNAHGQVIDGAIGSAAQVYKGFQEQFAWVKEMFEATGRAAKYQEFAFKMMLALGADATPREDINVTFPDRPAQDTSDFPFHHPVVIRQTTIAGLETDLASTQTSALLDAASSWRSAAASAEEWASILNQAAADLSTNNTGDWVDQATARMEELAEQSRVYAGNARTMASSVHQVASIASHYLQQIRPARIALESIPEPTERALAEQAYLQTFYTAYEAELPTAVPPIRNLLMPATHEPGSGENITTGMGGGNPAGTGLDTATELARNSISAGAAARGEIPGSGQVATHAAHAPATAVPEVAGNGPVSSGSGASAPAGSGTPASVLATLGRHGIQAPRTIAEGGAWPGLANAGRFGETPGTGGSSAVRRGAGLSGPDGSDRASGVPGSQGGTGTGVPGGQRTGALGDGRGSRGSNGAGSGVSGQSAGAGAGSRGGAGMGGLPIAGAPLAPGTNSRDARGKVKQVTSKVEYSKNLRDLLGEPRPFIPGVIGTWVREQ